MDFFESDPISTLIFKKHFTLESGWAPKEMAQVVNKLKQLRFFKRFPKKAIEEFIPKMKVDIVSKDQLLFVNSRIDSTQEVQQKQDSMIDEDGIHHISVMRQTFNQRHVGSDSNRKVYIILKGWIIAKEHKENILLPTTLAKFMEGE